MEVDTRLAKEIAGLQHRLLGVETDTSVIRALLVDTARLVGADAAMAAWLDEGAPWIVTWNAGPQIEAYFARTFAGVDRDGNIRSTDPDLDRVNLTRRQMGTGVRHERAFASRESIENAAFHREAFAPAGMHNVIGMTTRLAVGEAIFAMGYDTADSPSLADGRSEIILNLLLPAFAHGFGAIDRRARNLERLEQAIARSDADVRVHAADTGPAAMLSLPLPDPGAGFLSVSTPDTATLARRLARAHGLTKRQQEVAQHVLDGLSTRDIAAHLDISLNTARRHCEAVLTRTGARRRGQLNTLALRVARRS